MCNCGLPVICGMQVAGWSTEVYRWLWSGLQASMQPSEASSYLTACASWVGMGCLTDTASDTACLALVDSTFLALESPSPGGQSLLKWQCTAAGVTYLQPRCAVKILTQSALQSSHMLPGKQQR